MNMTEEMGRKNELLNPAFIFLPSFLLPENSALTHKNHGVRACERHCYIFHAADDRRSYHSACIRVFDKAGVCVCGGSFGDLTDCMRVYEMLCVGIYLNVLLHALRLSR